MLERAGLDGGAGSRSQLDLRAEVGQYDDNRAGGRVEPPGKVRVDSQIDNEAELRKYVLLSASDLGADHQNVGANDENLANYAVWLEEKKKRANQLASRAEIDYANITAQRNCKIHKDEPIKYFCRDDKAGLCAECIVHHAKHDFIFADEDAAKEVKGNLDYLFKSVNDHHEKYSELHRNLESSRQDLEKFKDQELSKITEAFQKMKAALEHRELWFKQQYEMKVKDKLHLMNQES